MNAENVNSAGLNSNAIDSIFIHSLTQTPEINCHINDVKIPTKNLTWYEKIDLTNKLIVGLIPEGYKNIEEPGNNGEVGEILWIADNLLAMTPEERIKTAIKLLKQIQEVKEGIYQAIEKLYPQIKNMSERDKIAVAKWVINES